MRPESTRPESARPAARIAGLGVALPAGVETIEEIEARIERESGRLPVPRGTLAAISGIRSRRAVGPGEYASTLAAGAARCALEDAGTRLADIDLLIFASTSQDQIEPATAHNVAHELGYRGGSAFDVKNACNSFVEGIRVAEAMLATGAARRALVVTGETPTLAARYAVPDRRAFRHAFIGYTVGDVGGAVVLEPSDDERGVFYRDSWSASRALGRVDGPGRRVAPPARRRAPVRGRRWRRAARHRPLRSTPRSPPASSPPPARRPTTTRCSSSTRSPRRSPTR